MRQGLRIDANYTEDVVGFALESFLTLLSFPRQRFSIEPFSRGKERWLGADARLHSRIRGFRPFYMQFKRPAAYPDFSTSKIIIDRRKAGLTTTPRALYFPLRQKQLTHHDFQHNVLFRLRRRLLKLGLGDAAYVCPLFLDRSAYRLNLHWSGLARWGRFWRHHPWELEDVLIEDGGRGIRFDRMPVFAEHISVPPHVAVTTENGTDLCFHSPEALPDGSTNLATFLGKISAGFLDGGEKLSPDRSDQMLSELIADVYSDQETATATFRTEGEDPIGRWFAWGDHLRSVYEIEQFALVRWEDEAGLF
ncbi:MAG: hypothetical protein ABL931_18750 [Usitatibacteraceae bacterium]